MRCAHVGCFSSIGWLGVADDKAIAQLAKDRGWKVTEGKGWVCPHHINSIKDKTP